MVHYLGVCKHSKESNIVDLRSDGVLQYVFIEERYTRKKYYKNFPTNAMLKMLVNRNDNFRIGEFSKKDFNFIDKLFGNISYVNIQKPLHHLFHAYESFYTSGFDRAAVLVVDGYGSNDGNDVESISLYHKFGKSTELLKKYYINDSLGRFYKKACDILEFGDNEEGHFMGLSSYGVPFEERYAEFNNGRIKINFDDGIARYKANNKTLNCINSINFVATVQRDLVECLLGLVKYIKDITHEDNLCLSGGVFNNVLVNNAICESGIFKNVWCSPAPGDFGISIGRAYIIYEVDNEKVDFHRLDNAYKGETMYYNDNVIDFLNKSNTKYVEISNDEIVNMLCDGKVLAWFQGASEFGRRALGHRSLIANPSNYDMYKLVSGKIKGRAPYRPLACTVPDELFDLMFDVKNKDLTEYMLRAIPIRNEMKKRFLLVLILMEPLDHKD